MTIDRTDNYIDRVNLHRPDYVEIIDAIFDTIYAECKDHCVKAAGDDRAWNLENQIARFLIESERG